MKYMVQTTKNLMAFTLVASLLATTAYGAEVKTPTVVATITTTGEATLPQLDFKTALEKAKKKNPQLVELQKTNEFLQESKEDLWEITGSFTMPSYDYQKWVGAAVFGYTSAMYDTNSGLVQNKYTTKITDLSLEATLMSTFTTILDNEATLEVLKETDRLGKLSYEQDKLKYDLGLISKYQLDQTKSVADKNAMNVSQLEKTMEQIYMKLNATIGETPEKRFDIVYDVPYTPYVLQGDIETYIHGKSKTDYNILLAEQAVEDAKFNKNYLSEAADGSANKKNNMSYDTASRNLKNTKEDKAVAIRNAYIQLQQAEADREQALADLKDAQAKLKTAEVNYQAGNAVKLTVEQAKLGVMQKEYAIKKLENAYVAQVFAFENTSLITSGIK